MDITFQNWLEGGVTLIYAEKLFKGLTVDEIDKLVFASWGDFSEEDVSKIKQKQREIFDDLVSSKLDGFKKIFTDRYKHSKLKEELLENEKQGCFNVLFSKIPQKKLIFNERLQIAFEDKDLIEIQNYSKRTILKGIDDGLDYIHSPDNKYQRKDKMPSQAYAQLLYNYFEWLGANFQGYEESEQKRTLSSEERIVEPENKYKGIFKNGFAYEMFIELEELTVGKDKIADYAFIFHKMKSTKILIFEDTKHNSFIDMLNEDFSAGLTINKFPFKNQNSKQTTFYTLLKRYKQNIQLCVK